MLKCFKISPSLLIIIVMTIFPFKLKQNKMKFISLMTEHQLTENTSKLNSTLAKLILTNLIYTLISFISSTNKGMEKQNHKKVPWYSFLWLFFFTFTVLEIFHHYSFYISGVVLVLRILYQRVIMLHNVVVFIVLFSWLESKVVLTRVSQMVVKC